MSTTSQQFEGTTIEEALSAAVSSLGEDLEILDAQRVRRRGVLGMRRRERYEVTAAPGAAEPKGFEDVLRRMVERVDDAERSIGTDLSDTDRSWWGEADFVLPEAGTDGTAAAPTKRSRLGRRRGARPAPTDGVGPSIELDVRSQPSPGAVATSTLVAPTPTPHAVAAGVPEQPGRDLRSTAVATPVLTPQEPIQVESSQPVLRDDAPSWSREALLALDLPPALVGRMRCDELEGDLDWVAALAKAIDELLETAESMSGPCELTGHGAASAVHLLRGACDGFRLDSLIIDGHRVPATPLELALAIRPLLRVGQ